MKVKKLKRIIALTVIVCMAITSTPVAGFASELPQKDQQDGTGSTSAVVTDTTDAGFIALEEMEPVVTPKDINEVTADDIIIEESSESTTVFDLGGGERAKVFYSYNVRYRDDEGNLVDIDPELVAISEKTATEQGQSLVGYKYETKNGKSKNYIPETLSESTPLIMEKDELSITMTPTGYLNSILAKSNGSGKGRLQNDIVRDTDNSNKNKKVKMVFGNETDEAYLEYIALNEGIKENIVLNEVPKKNEFTFKLKIKGMTYSMNSDDGGITFYDEETGDIVASLQAPFMNDATGEAYSEAISYSMKRSGNSDNYTLTITADEDYLNSPDRVYPVTIDPTATWYDTSDFKDAYVNSNSPTTNYYNASTTVMPSGRGSSGAKYRTYIKFLSLRAGLIGADISSASLDVYENGDGGSGYSVRVFDIAEDWSYTNVTWNTVPTYNTPSLDSFTSTGTAGTKRSFDVTDWVQSIADGGSNYGLVIRNYTESSTSYVEFYGSRTSSTSYRPRLTVLYTEDKPTTAASVSATKSTYAKGDDIVVSWSGITANRLDHIEYKVDVVDEDGNILNTKVDYTYLTTAQSSGTMTIPGSSSFSVANYRIYIRGVSQMGTNGTGKYCRVEVVKNKPSTPASVTTAQNPYPMGSYVTMYWTGLTGTNLTEVQYRIALCDDAGQVVEFSYVPYTTFSTSPTESGSVVIPNSNQLEPGKYLIYIRGKNSDGVYGTGLGCYVNIDEDRDPEVGNITISKSGATVSTANYISPGSISVQVDGISDELPIKVSNLSYSLYGPGNSYVAVDLVSSNLTEYESGKYRATFTIPESYISQSGTYTLFFWAFDDSINLGYNYQYFLVDADAPTGSISVSSAESAIETSQLEGMAKIAVNVNDAHSGVENSTLELYNGTAQEPGTKAATLLTNSSIPKLLDFNSYDYADGNYTLKLTVTDKVGYTVTAWKDITIDNRMAKPTVGVSISPGNSSLNVQWGYQEEMSELDYIQYNLDSADSWTDVTTTNKTSGSFTVSLPEGAEGTHSILVRGMDISGEYGESTRYDFNIDSESPTVDITGIHRGIVSGTVADDYLASWTISVKERDNAESEYVQIASGSNAVNAGRIGIADLSSIQYALDTWYTVKVEAVDESGNIGNDTFDVYKDANYEVASLIKSENRILRSLGQSMTLPNFIVSSTEDALEMKNGSLFSSVLWVVNGSVVSENASYTADFSMFTDGITNTIAAAGKDASGNVYYSNDVYLNSAEDSFNFSEQTEGVIEQTITLSQNAVAFTLNAPTTVTTAEESESVITYYAKVGDGEYQMITPGTVVHVFSLNNQTISANALTIKTVADSTDALSLLNSFSVSLGVMDGETFTVSSAEGYWPENVSAQDKINYKTYVKWDTPETMPLGLYYEVYRSTISNFIPGESTLVAENITDGYWVDINTNYNISLYYKVRAVVKDTNGNIISVSSFSDLAESTPIDENEYLKALGHKDYWAYEDIATPSGSGYIEKSQGNFLYEQTDAELANEQLPVTLARTYNSMSTSKSAFGYGWTYSYDIELLRLGKDNNLDEGILVYRDGSGTLYQFKREEDTYISSLGKYVNLTKEDLTTTVVLPDNTNEEDNQTVNIIVSSAYTMTTRDGITYRFDSSGKLVYMEEANGNLLLFAYDSKRGLLSKITTGNNISIDIEYYDSTGGNDALTIRQITLPDGQKIIYEYENSLLTRATRMAEGQVSGGIEYTYDYNTSRKMTSLTDGKANTYSITYVDAGTGEAKKFTYPAAGGASESVQITRDQLTNSTVTEKLMGTAVVKTQTDYFDGSGRCIRHEDGAGDSIYAVDYEYKDGLISKETTYVTYSLLNKGTDGSAGSIATATSTKVKTYEYDENENLVKEIDENAAVADMVYALTGEWNSYLPTEYSEVVDGVTVADEVYTYDSFGNMIKLQDNVNNRVTEYEYYTGASDKAKGAVKSEKEYELVDGTYSASTLISSTDTVFAYGSDRTKTETVTSVSGGNKTVTVSAYDVMGRVLSETVYTYTKYGTVDETISRDTNTYTYDGYGRVTSVTTIRSKVNSSLADIEGTTFTSTETKTYDDNGTLISETGADGITTTYQYDALNRITSMTRTDGVLSQITNTTYSCGNVSVNEGKADKTTYNNALITTQTVNGVVENITYQDGMGRTIRSEVYGVVTDYSYDAQGNRVTEMVLTGDDGNGRLTYHVLDEEGRETATVYNPVWDETLGSFTIGADAICEAVIYDKSGNVTQSTDGEGNVTKFTYDEQGRLTKVVLVNGTDETNVTNFTYADDMDSGLFTSTVTMTGAEGGISTETSDESGNLIKVSDKGKLDENITPIETTCTYDARGNLLKEIHKAGDYITYAYDSKDRVTIKVQYNQNGSAVYRTEYTYYDNDLVKEMLDYTVSGSAKTLYRYTYKEYDGLKRLTKLAEINTDTVPASVEGYSVNYTYDLNDNITEITYGSSLGTEVSGVKYVYENNRLKEVKVKAGSTYYLVKGYTYNPDGSVETVKDYYNFRSGGAEYILLTYTYDSFGRVVSMVYTLGNDTVESHSYAYDKNNNIIREANINTYAGVNEVREYTYDYMGQLTNSVIKNITTSTVQVEGEADDDGNVQMVDQVVTEENIALSTGYTYDKAGNRTTKTENGTVTSYTYNGLNQLKTESGVNSLTYTYDANGNQTGIAGMAEGETVNRAFTYTPAGMLASYTDGTSTQTNLYNGGGQRIRKTEGSDVTNYFYQEGSVLYTTGSDSALKSFNLLNVSDIFASSRINGTSESYYFYTEDMRGSTVNIIDSSASQVASYWYSDFGEVTEAKAASYGNFVNEIQYTGAVYDELTGLLYLNARFYDPATGRFITQDTYRGERNNPDTWHLYAYCANNPINYVDPSGHAWETVLDVASIGWSTFQLLTAPSWINLGYLIWDIGAACIPFVPGSYTLKAVKNTAEVTEIAIKIPSKIKDLKQAKNLTVGTYKSLNKLFKGQKLGKIEIHHIIEKRFAEALGVSPDKMVSIAIDKKLHKTITKRFRQACPLGTNYRNLSPMELRKIVKKVYKDMPALKKIALEQLS